MANAFIEDPPYLKRVNASSISYIGFGFLALWLATLQFALDRQQTPLATYAHNFLLFGLLPRNDAARCLLQESSEGEGTGRRPLAAKFQEVAIRIRCLTSSSDGPKRQTFCGS